MVLALLETCQDPALLQQGFLFTVVVVDADYPDDVLDLVDFRSMAAAVLFTTRVNMNLEVYYV